MTSEFGFRREIEDAPWGGGTRVPGPRCCDHKMLLDMRMPLATLKELTAGESRIIALFSTCALSQSGTDW